MKKNRELSFLNIWCITATILTWLLLSACSPPQEPPLRIGTNFWPGYEPLYLARSLGYYDNTQIKMIEMSSASDVIRAIRNGDLEGAALTLDEVLTLVEDDFDLKIVLIFNYSAGGDVLLVKPDIKSLTDLRGKRIAVEYKAVGAILLDSALHTAELDTSDITIVGCSANDHIKCYNENDAVITFDPAKTRLLKLGAREIFSSLQIEGKIVDVLVVTAETTHTNKQSISQLLDGYFKARNYLDNNPLDAATRMATRTALSPDEMLASYDGIRLLSLGENHRMLSGPIPPFHNTVNELSQFMLEKHLLQRQITPDLLIDALFLPKTNTP